MCIVLKTGARIATGFSDWPVKTIVFLAGFMDLYEVKGCYMELVDNSIDCLPATRSPCHQYTHVSKTIVLTPLLPNSLTPKTIPWIMPLSSNTITPCTLKPHMFIGCPVDACVSWCINDEFLMFNRQWRMVGMSFAFWLCHYFTPQPVISQKRNPATPHWLGGNLQALTAFGLLCALVLCWQLYA